MKLPSVSLPSPQVRQYLYGLILTGMPLLVALNIVDPSLVPLWLNLAGAILGTAGTGVAFAALRGQRKDGSVQ